MARLTCLFVTMGALLVLAGAVGARPLYVALIAGKTSHGPGEHEYEKSCRLLARCLENSLGKDKVEAAVYTDGWPQDERVLDHADTILLFTDGADHHEEDDPILSAGRLAVLHRQMQRGAGLVLLHYSVIVPSQRGGPLFLDWAGGYFDYEHGPAPSHWLSKIQVATTTPVPASPHHPISRGRTPFPLHEEYYYNIKFRDAEPSITPILTTALPGETSPQTVAWALERANGARGFAYTGGHFYTNWQVEPYRKMILNAIVWTAHGNVPKQGVSSAIPAEEVFPPAVSPIVAAAPAVRHADSTDWPNVGNDRGGMRYSPLTQVDRGNVTQLHAAWVYHTGDSTPGTGTTIECTPIVIDGVMYVTTVKSKAAALDAATGREIWKFDPFSPHLPGLAYAGVNRGVAYWSDGRRNGERRVLLGIADGHLISLDARTGLPDPKFGTGGVVDLRANMGRDMRGLSYGPTSAPAVWKNLVVLGFLCGEGPEPAAPGDVRAFDIRTGHEAWRFHTVPRPGEFGHQEWPGSSWVDRGGANAWSGLTIDDRRGIVFAGLGSASFDFFGGDRPGTDLFANCDVALDARTGRRLWHFQTLHHDLWDHDLPCPPVLVTVQHGGRAVDAVAQVTKTGYLFLFDRLTGRPLFPVTERPVPPSDVPGETASPTQPIPVKPPPFARQSVERKDLSNLPGVDRAFIEGKFDAIKSGMAFAPPSRRGSIDVPGFHGGATWSGASFDPAAGLLYVSVNNVPTVTTLVKMPVGSPYPYSFTGYFRFSDRDGYPAITPPWGTLTAIDLNRGEIKWQVPLGAYSELTARGIPATGTENFGGTIVTAGGLVFIGGTKDAKPHAFDKTTGTLLWETQLDFGGYATACTYAVDGRQFVAIAAGGGGKLATRSGDEFVAYALPANGR